MSSMVVWSRGPVEARWNKDRRYSVHFPPERVTYHLNQSSAVKAAARRYAQWRKEQPARDKLEKQ